MRKSRHSDLPEISHICLMLNENAVTPDRFSGNQGIWELGGRNRVQSLETGQLSESRWRTQDSRAVSRQCGLEGQAIQDLAADFGVTGM